MVSRGAVRFIHEAPPMHRKRVVRGQKRRSSCAVRFYPKMEQTNVQDRLIAIHNLDCPWRPSDLEQRQGRIERLGNMFPEVEVYRYVTEQTFDAYLISWWRAKEIYQSDSE